MEFWAGAVLSLAVGLGAAMAGLDRDRSLYPVILIVISAYYDLFAVMAGEPGAVWPELAVSLAFLATAILGYRTSLWVVVAALIAHGLFDVVRPVLTENRGVPVWWPAFCLSFDTVAAGVLAARLLRSTTAWGRIPADFRPRAGALPQER